MWGFGLDLGSQPSRSLDAGYGSKRWDGSSTINHNMQPYVFKLLNFQRSFHSTSKLFISDLHVTKLWNKIGTTFFNIDFVRGDTN